MIRKLLLCGLFAGLAVAARADEAAIRNAVEALMDDVKVEAVTRTDVLGLYEVRIATPRGLQILYADESGNYLFDGSIIDLRAKRDLTEARLRELTFVKLADLPLAQAFKIVRGKGTRQLAYFSDPRCPWCRKLDQELTQVDDVTVHVFLIPIIAPDSAAISKAVWCSPDRAKTWLELMLNGVQPAPAQTSCDTPLEKNLALARKHGVNGTPTLIFADGRRESGFKRAAEVSALLDRAAKR